MAGSQCSSICFFSSLDAGVRRGTKQNKQRQVGPLYSPSVADELDVELVGTLPLFERWGWRGEGRRCHCCWTSRSVPLELEVPVRAREKGRRSRSPHDLITPCVEKCFGATYETGSPVALLADARAPDCHARALALGIPRSQARAWELWHPEGCMAGQTRGDAAIDRRLCDEATTRHTRFASSSKGRVSSTTTHSRSSTKIALIAVPRCRRR